MMETTRPEPLYNASELRRMFDELALDAVIARSGRNVAYLAGMRFPGTLGRLQDFAHAPRAVLAVMPRDGDGTLVASNIAAGLARRTTWLEDIRTYTEYSESPFTVAGTVLAERGLAAGRIGVERREIGVQQWDELVAALPDAELIDCTDALEAVRADGLTARLGVAPGPANGFTLDEAAVEREWARLKAANPRFFGGALLSVVRFTPGGEIVVRRAPYEHLAVQPTIAPCARIMASAAALNSGK